ncbi:MULTISPECIES: methenyltetrahydrofolate cyclohydrolase [Methylosinus]|uniref:Cyclodeaminase/cyclohydrolase family protein n=1 Tax=Methylosinus sporium TaxID=428 RepID=A0A2U1SWD5_METSR|nr:MULTISPECIES: methenyltetrahydrofolate cyclohydrolase [Methylosinus]MBU3888370.1 cyclodeaminase/cyclohydrolase family protein [Methylosinus sp. KRF6]PWB95883.1 methenyltetrahydrofolate cyclohydrolase [Methylosinus sporium]TRL33963.1 cyclodeaminase/cyclohydrolase family protein [Methylosinus sporium]
MTKDETIGKFLDDLASERPTPGGGGAAAVMGAIGAALVSMVANLTIGKKNYEAVEEDLKAARAEAERVRAELTAAIEEDVVAFNSVMGAYGLPRATDEDKAARSAAIQAALKDATLAPLRAVKACFEVIVLSEAAADKGNLNVISDAGVAVLAANAGLRSAALNVYINAKAIKDRDFAEKQIAEVEALLAAAAEKTEAVYKVVRDKIGS